MDVTKIPPMESDPMRGSTTATPLPGSASQAAGAAPSPELASPLDWVDIKPLDMAGALQVLIAEVRASLELPSDQSTTAGLEPDQAAQAVVRMFLRMVPTPEETSGMTEWTAAAGHAETALLAGLDRALDGVAAWRAVPATVIEGATATRALIVAAVTDDPPNPVWLRPEWLGLAPAIQRFWRRRRFARRRLSDPDWHERAWDDVDNDTEFER